MYKHIFANLGFLLQIAGILTVLPILIGLYLNEIQTLAPLFLTCISFLVCGFLMNALCERKDLDFKSSCTLILLAFLIIPLIGAGPYICDDTHFNSPNPTSLIDRFTNAYFESVSGFTTTGFSFVSNTTALPKSLLVYRSMTELMGGVGIVFLLLAFFHSRKSLNGLGNALGIDHIGDNMKRIFFSVFLIYCIYVIVFTVIFYFLNSNTFQGIINAGCFAIDTITGGYQSSSLQQYLSTPLMMVCVIVLMFIGSVNFNFNYRLFTFKLKKAVSKEILLYLLVILIGTLLIFFLTGREVLDSLFHIVSMSSSTGYDKNFIIPENNNIVRSVFIFIMILGGCGFSMAGGIKMNKIISFFKSIKESVKGILTKEKVIQEESQKVKENNIEHFSALVAIILFVATLFVFSIIFSAITPSFTDALFEVGSALTTNGISMGATTVLMPIAYKWLLIIAMIIGRIEIIPILIALSPYKRKK